MTDQYEREAGKRIKQWGIDGDIRRHIEGTAEHSIMYRALGTEPKTQHPFNLYGDIQSQGKALRETFATNQQVVPAIARRLVERGFRGMAGHGLGTSQFVAHTASQAYWQWAGWDARDLDSLEYVNYGHPIDFTRTAFFSYSGSGSTVVGRFPPSASMTGPPNARTMAEPCRSSQGELRISPRTCPGWAAAHNVAVSPPVE